MTPSTANSQAKLFPDPLSEYQQGWWDALTEAMRIIGAHYARDFMDPFCIPSPHQPLTMVAELRELRDILPRNKPKPVKVRQDAE